MHWPLKVRLGGAIPMVG